MEIDSIIGAVEKYLREFILYLTAFFWNGKQGDQADPFADSLNKSVIFSILSAVVSAYLWAFFLPPNPKAHVDIDMLHIVVDNLLRWASLGLLLYIILRLLQEHVHVLLPVIASMRLFAVSHVVAVYAAYVTTAAVHEFFRQSQANDAAPVFAVVVAYSVEFLLICLFTPREIFAFLPRHPIRKALACIMYFAAVTVVLLTPLVVMLNDDENRNSRWVQWANDHRIIAVIAIMALITAIGAIAWQERANATPPAPTPPDEGNKA